nr:N-6 DNA methylase [Saccharopolyspora sp. HNM0983]
MFDLPADTTACVGGIPDDAIEQGEVFTRSWVVDLVLDLVGYVPSTDLAARTLVEPACGEGAFLGAVAERVGRSCGLAGRSILDAAESVRAYDLLPRNVVASRERVAETLVQQGWPPDDAQSVARMWVRAGDFLLRGPAEHGADFVVGNPPYVRLEDIPDDRLIAYRERWPSMIGRADLYVGFLEAALSALRPGGALGFICADRWMRNQYGRALRQLVCRDFAVDAVLSMHEVDCFEEPVSAYPAVTVLRNGRQGSALVADTTAEFGSAQAAELLEWSRRGATSSVRESSFTASRTTGWFEHADSWPVGSPERLAFLADLEKRLAPLHDAATGTRVGIGIATGADKVYLTQDDDLVERDRLLPLAMVADIRGGHLAWSGTYLVNPWTPDGELVDLERYPRLAEHCARHGEQLTGRHIARKQPPDARRHPALPVAVPAQDPRARAGPVGAERRRRVGGSLPAPRCRPRHPGRLARVRC